MFLRDAAYCGKVELGKGRGEIQVSAQRPVEAFGLAYRHIFTRLAVDGGWTFVHAAGVLLDDRAWLFAGSSGAGKSTIAGMLAASEQGARIIHDDQLFLGTSEGKSAIRAVPYMGDERFIHDRVGAWPVNAVYFLRQDTRAFVKPMEPGPAAARLLAAPLEWLDEPSNALKDYLGRSLNRLVELVRGAVCGELHFSLTELPREITSDRRTL
ncbi:MAG: hypothetical protein GXP54_09340 [Deltaproteobacteria bacterium]|nr:hypothetical protein [Deltaproteobacteria bacterium]